MAEITASMVKELREKTDAPMMECKKALAEAGGDLAKAEEILRVKLGSKASKAAARVAAEGVVAVHIDSATASSARSSRSTAKPTSSPRTTTSCIRAGPCGVGRDEQSGRCCWRCPRCRSDEARSRRRAPRWSARSARTWRSAASRASRRRAALASYVHGGSKIGVLVDISGGDDELAKDIAMHVAASKPKSLDASGVPAELLDAERRIAIEKAREAGKPEAMLEKIAEGTRAEVPEGSDAARPGLRQGRRRQADDRAAAEGARARRSTASCSTSLARASRRSRAISPPRSPPWRGGVSATCLSNASGHDDDDARRARLPPRSAQAVGRSPDGGRRLRHQSRRPSRRWSPTSARS